MSNIWGYEGVIFWTKRLKLQEDISAVYYLSILAKNLKQRDEYMMILLHEEPFTF